MGGGVGRKVSGIRAGVVTALGKGVRGHKLGLGLLAEGVCGGMISEEMYVIEL